ncbi:alpha/beta-hydrolase [Dendrothele bispora CBS 962.96]|uniref:Carboxylic ester hydrolase n=1 Tax=Dendrothele bispora (strain CBS 962.96) TaxID=1314807 RepID=A0A4S8MDW1_DENBC|nr:alpha/beta-hydrolase [Dendrothele bispora CBS 962.96]
MHELVRTSIVRGSDIIIWHFVRVICFVDKVIVAPNSLRLLSLVTALLSSLTLAQLPTVTDTVHNVTYIGTSTVPGIEKFLNIPYGKDTSGQRRFTSPEPTYLPSGTVYNATTPGPVCPQPTSGGFAFFTNLTESDLSEDCLRLKVARPTELKDGEKLPVMVWIYGGGLFSGHINERTNEPDALILQSVANGLPVVFVAMNYRLNIFGFALSEVLRDSKDLNVGLKDQRLALEWVQENIQFFGGDPDRVTIFGQSSGALSVSLQILAYGGAFGAPFHGAIIESTALEPTSTSNLTIDSFNAVANLTGCDTFGNPQGPETLSCLRQLPMETLLNVTIVQHDSTADSNDGDIYLPTVDGDFLPLASSELARRGMFVKMPVIIGWTKDDATLFTPSDKTAHEFLNIFYPDLNETTVETLLELYPAEDFAPNPAANLSVEFYRSAQVFRDIIMSCPSFLLGHAMAEKFFNDSDDTFDSSSSNSTVPPVFLYEFNQTIHTPFLESIGLPGLGVIHTSELPYVYANFETYNITGVIRPTVSDFALLEQVSRSWTTFVNTGVPSLTDKDTLQDWKGSYQRPGAGMLDASLYVIGGPNAGISTLEGEGSNEAVAIQKLKERCEFLNRDDIIEQLKY